jgi:DNA processing protein
MDILKLWFALSEISSNIKLKLLTEFGSLENIRDFITMHKSSTVLDNKLTDKLIKAYDLQKLYRIMEKLEKEQIGFTTIKEEQYPKKLRLFDDAPFALFYKGNISKINEERSISIVGSRTCTRYGADITKLITEELVQNNLNIVSGMARGIDTIVHKTAVINKGYTVAILGSGVDVVYPKENLKLYNEIISSGGCVISEFAPETKPLSMNFPIRNRIISGLSDLVIVAEAGEKSGSLITATKALEQGKEVMAIPGSIFSEESKGTNKLIKEGAHVFTNIDDVFYLLGIDRNKNNKIINDNNKGSVCEDIYRIIDNNPIHIDDIIRLTNIDIKQIYELLFEMQLKDEILCLNGSFYVRVNKII